MDEKQMLDIIVKGFESVNEQFSAINKRLDKIDVRLDSIESRLDRVEETQKEHTRLLKATFNQTANLSEFQTDTKAQLSSLDSKVSTLAADNFNTRAETHTVKEMVSKLLK